MNKKTRQNVYFCSELTDNSKLNPIKDEKIRAAVVGYGNIGQYVVEALEAAPDFEIAGIVRRSGAENKPAELEAYAVVKDIKELKDVDVAVLVLRPVAWKNMRKRFWQWVSIR